MESCPVLCMDLVHHYQSGPMGKNYFTDRKMTEMIPISFPRHLMRFVTVRYKERWEMGA